MESFSIALPVGGGRSRNLIELPLVALRFRRCSSECAVTPLGIGIQAIQLSPYHAGLAGRHLQRLPVAPAFRACCCPLWLSPSGKPDDPGTFLRVPPDCVRDSTPRSAAHGFPAPGSRTRRFTRALTAGCGRHAGAGTAPGFGTDSGPGIVNSPDPGPEVVPILVEK